MQTKFKGASLIQKRKNRESRLVEQGHHGEKNADDRATDQHRRKKTFHDVEIEIAFFLIGCDRIIEEAAATFDAIAVAEGIRSLTALTDFYTHSLTSAKPLNKKFTHLRERN
ncbi:MAG: hypothetical protein ACAI44_37935 [Candidatus Sericytochromatia bacterium]